MTARAENWYVYYAAPADGAAALNSVHAMQRALTLAGGVRARLEERVATDKPTWMEVYEAIDDPAAFAVKLEAAVTAYRLPELTGTRQIERFRSL